MLPSVKTNFKLLKQSIACDFSIVKINKNNTFLNTKFRLKTNQNINFDSINLLILNKNLKAFIKLLYFSKKGRNLLINIYILDHFFKVFLESLLKEFYITAHTHVEVKNSFKNLKVVSRTRTLAIILDEFFSRKNCLNTIIEHNITLITKFNTLEEYKSSGIYKNYNNINDFKKVLFFFSVFKKVLTSHVKS